jgi:putative membrane protein
MISYNPHDWRSHLLDIRGSMLPEIMGRVALCVGWSVVVTACHELLPKWIPGFSLSVPSTVHTLVGMALGLLLVFRTNSSYDKFWEGRKQWGGMVNECRNLARQASVMLSGVPELRRELILWTAAFPYAAMSVLRGARSLAPSSKDLPPAEVGACLAAQHMPLAVAQRILQTSVAARDRGAISDHLLQMFDQNVNLLIDYIGACERIHRTPIPFAYMVHLRRALILYCFTLPFVLVDPLHWWTVAGTFLLAFVFFGIEEIGVEIEDPFGFDENDLPLERFCQTIEANLLAVLNPAEAPLLGDNADEQT